MGKKNHHVKGIFWAFLIDAAANCRIDKILPHQLSADLASIN